MPCRKIRCHSQISIARCHVLWGVERGGIEYRFQWGSSCDLPTQRAARPRLTRSEASKRAASNHCGRASGGSARSGGCGTGRGVVSRMHQRGTRMRGSTSAQDEKPGRRTDSLARSRFGIRSVHSTPESLVQNSRFCGLQCLRRHIPQGTQYRGVGAWMRGCGGWTEMPKGRRIEKENVIPTVSR